jgi:hypothetical protein
MRRFALALGGGGAAFAAFLLLVGPLNWASGSPPVEDPSATPSMTMSATPSSSESPSTSPTDTPTPSGTPTTATPTPTPTSTDVPTCDNDRTAADYLYQQGFAKSDFVIGDNVIDWDALPAVNVDQAFSSTPIRSQSELEKFITSDDPVGKAVQQLLGHKVLNFVAVQFQNSVKYSGNWYIDGNVAKQGGDLMVLAGDVWWIAVNDGCMVEPSSSIRAVCGNVGFTALEPAVARRS